MSGWSCVVLAWVVACGSSPSPEEFAKQHGPAVKAKLDAIKVAAAAGLNAPDDPSIKAVPGVVFEGTGVNALAALYDDTVDLTADAPATRFSYPDDPIRSGKVLLGLKTNEPVYAAGIGPLESTKYVLVVYRTKYSAPSKSADNAFEPGAVQSTNVLVELGTNKILGSFTAEAESSAEVRAPDYDGHAGAEAAYQSYLDGDLRKHWADAIEEGIAKRWAGTKPPYL
ncbi:MAG TPA: hypothetical protein VGM90_33640 [Kofleriaceae bacterium]|jgi:hypothetical protein